MAITDGHAEEPASKLNHTIERLRGLAKLFHEMYPQFEGEQNEQMLKAYVAHGNSTHRPPPLSPQPLRLQAPSIF